MNNKLYKFRINITRGDILKSKLVFLYIFSACCLAVIFIILVSSSKEVKADNIENDLDNTKSDINNEINFESLDKIQLYRSVNGKIDELNLNYYLLCTVASEMPFKYEYEALKSQAIISRTYLYNKIINNKEENADVCDNFAHCQAFNDLDKLEEIWKNVKGYSDEEIKEGEEKIKRAIVETDGQVISYQSIIIDALFHASSPHGTEDASAIWSHENIPYLKPVESVEDEDYEYINSKVEVDYATLKNTLIDKGYLEDLTIDEFSNIKILDYTKGNRVNKVRIGQNDIKAEDLRILFGLKSTDFKFEIRDGKIVFDVCGFGHGVGLSQVGANSYARRGWSAEEIIKHYYQGVDIVDKSELYK